MPSLYWSVAALPSVEALPALRAGLEAAFPTEEGRAYLDELVVSAATGRSLPPRVALARLFGLSLLPPLLARAGIDASRLRLWRDEHGRPYAVLDGAGAPPFDFNVSHADGHAACALLVGGGRVGVDVEEPIPPRRALPLVRRYCTEGELRLLQGRSDDEIADDFTRIWTIREALCKQDGRGMPLRFDATRIPDGLAITTMRRGSGGTRITLCYPLGTEVLMGDDASDGLRTL